MAGFAVFPGLIWINPYEFIIINLSLLTEMLLCWQLWRVYNAPQQVRLRLCRSIPLPRTNPKQNINFMLNIAILQSSVPLQVSVLEFTIANCDNDDGATERSSPLCFVVDGCVWMNVCVWGGAHAENCGDERFGVVCCALCLTSSVQCWRKLPLPLYPPPPSTSTPLHPDTHPPPTASPFYRWRIRADSTKMREGAEWPRCARQNNRAPCWVPAPFLYSCLIGQKQHAWLCSAG